MILRTVLILFSIVLIAGCSGTRAYPDSSPHNVRIHTAVSGVTAVMDIHRITSRCETEYVGTVALDTPSIEIAVPAGKPSLIVVTFLYSSFLRQTSRTTSYDTELTPRAKSIYNIHVSYADKIYDVRVRETDVQSSVSRELARRGPETCKPS
jgi:hypothetical protein